VNWKWPALDTSGGPAIEDEPAPDCCKSRESDCLGALQKMCDAAYVGGDFEESVHLDDCGPLSAVTEYDRFLRHSPPYSPAPPSPHERLHLKAVCETYVLLDERTLSFGAFQHS
jgi:hypothetical protein